MTRIAILISGLSLLSILSLSACTADEETSDLAIINARIILPGGNEIENGSLTVTNGLIAQISETSVGISAKQTLDVGGRTVLPGYIDTHIHLLFRAGAKDDASLDAWINDGLSDLLDAYLAAGITSVMSMGDYYPRIVAVRDSINSGALIGPRVFIVGPVVTVPGGHPAGTLCRKNEWCSQNLAAQVDNPDAARQKIRELATAGVDGIKVVYGGNTLFPQMTDEILAAITEEARENDLAVYVHTTDPDKLAPARKLGVTHIAHTPSFRPFADIPSMPDAINGLPIATSPGVPKRDSVQEQREKNMRQLIEWGAIIALGIDISSKLPIDSLKLELNSLSTALTPEEIIAALTENAAFFMGAEDSLGKIKAGYIADLVVIEGNPLLDTNALTDISMVIKNGNIVIDSRASAE